ncbi:hypothetical protein VTI74DRAFT_8905 [Chaetomium olivicolor]
MCTRASQQPVRFLSNGKGYCDYRGLRHEFPGSRVFGPLTRRPIPASHEQPCGGACRHLHPTAPQGSWSSWASGSRRLYLHQRLKHGSFVLMLKFHLHLFGKRNGCFMIQHIGQPAPSGPSGPDCQSLQ